MILWLFRRAVGRERELRAYRRRTGRNVGVAGRRRLVAQPGGLVMNCVVRLCVQTSCWRRKRSTRVSARSWTRLSRNSPSTRRHTATRQSTNHQSSFLQSTAAASTAATLCPPPLSISISTAALSLFLRRLSATVVRAFITYGITLHNPLSGVGFCVLSAYRTTSNCSTLRKSSRGH